MWRLGVIGIAALASACGEVDPARTNRDFAELGCLDLSLKAIEASLSAKQLKALDESELSAAQGIGANPNPSFRTTSVGGFVVDYGQVEMPAPVGPYSLVCTGDFEKKIISTVQINGRIYRPKNGENWYFGSGG